MGPLQWNMMVWDLVKHRRDIVTLKANMFFLGDFEGSVTGSDYVYHQIDPEKT